MVYLFTALYSEAYVFIKEFNLVKDPENPLFQEFYHEEAGIRLTITGVGEIAAAAAVSRVGSLYKPKGEDVLLNVGICAHMAEGSGIFLCNKIIEQATGRTFYPDMLYCHDFGEEAIITGMLPWNGGKNGNGKLYDMEAAAVYQAGSYFFGPHQMIFLKIVSDKGEAKGVSREQIEDLMEKYRVPLCSYIRRIQRIIHKNRRENPLGQEEDGLTEKLCTDMHCSKVMRASVGQFIRYLALTGTEYRSEIHDMYEKGLLPCRDKREGKLRFEEFKRRVL